MGGRWTVVITVDNVSGIKTFYVRWCANRGNGWGKSYRKSWFATESAAREFADSKFAYLVQWVATVAPQASTWQPDFTCR